MPVKCQSLQPCQCWKLLNLFQSYAPLVPGYYPSSIRSSCHSIKKRKTIRRIFLGMSRCWSDWLVSTRVHVDWSSTVTYLITRLGKWTRVAKDLESWRPIPICASEARRRSLDVASGTTLEDRQSAMRCLERRSPKSAHFCKSYCLNTLSSWDTEACRPVFSLPL